jgi:PAS domain S-box-containing protein
MMTSFLTDPSMTAAPPCASRSSEGDERFRTIFEAAAVGIAVVDLTGRIVDSNPALQQLLGYSATELHGKTFIELTYPVDLNADLALINEMLAGQRETYQLEKRFIRKDNTLVWARVAASIVRDDDGTPHYGIGIVVDITERKTLEDQLLQAQKLEAIARLAGGISHDFSNLLTVIRGYSEFIISKAGDDAALRADAEEIRAAAERATLLTRQLLAFSRKQGRHPQMLDVNVVVRNVERMLDRVIGEDVTLTVRTCNDPCAVVTDEGQLEQVLMNLVVNARDAMPDGGSLIIETAEEVVRSKTSTVGGAKKHVRVSVVDNGCGIPDDVREHIFEPFFSTKEVTRGSGLGLSTVHGIVTQAGGFVRVRSEVGRGTAFDVMLPCASHTPSHYDVGLPSPVPTGTETILLAEDDPAVLRLAERALKDVGYRVLVAESGHEAIEIARTFEGRIDAIVTDVVMPGVSGPTLVTWMEFCRPDIRVLYISGYTNEKMQRHGMLEQGMSFLRKPFAPEDIARAVRSVLD